MKTIILCTLCLSAVSIPAADLPYHPFRKVDKIYYDLRPLYSFISKADKRYGPPPGEKIPARPLPAWLGVQNEGSTNHNYVVLHIFADGLLLQDQHTVNTAPGYTFYAEPIFLINYPYQDTAIDGQPVHFLALRGSLHKYQDVYGATHTVAQYDYGIPYDPAQLAAQRRTNSIVRAP